MYQAGLQRLAVLGLAAVVLLNIHCCRHTLQQASQHAAMERSVTFAQEYLMA